MKFTKTSIVVMLMCLVPATFAQRSRPDPVAQNEEKLKTAKNRWMLTPTDVRIQHDTAAPEQRNARDGFWDGLIGAATPLSQAQTKHLVIAPGGNVASAPEFPTIPNGVWLIGKIEGYHSFLSASERSIYTELNVRLEHVFGPSQPPLTKGLLIDVGRSGGTVLAPWGKVVSYQLYPREYDVQPGHTYLLLLQYHAEGNFYTEGKRWELTQGFVEADDELEQYRALHGKSQIHGLALPDLINYLDRKLASK